MEKYKFGRYARVGQFLVRYPIVIQLLKTFRGGHHMQFCIGVAYVDDDRFHGTDKDTILHIIRTEDSFAKNNALRYTRPQYTFTH